MANITLKRDCAVEPVPTTGAHHRPMWESPSEFWSRSSGLLQKALRLRSDQQTTDLNADGQPLDSVVLFGMSLP